MLRTKSFKLFTSEFLPLPDLFREAVCAEGLFPATLWDLTVVGETRRQRFARLRTAKTVCFGCPVKDLCRQIADSDPYARGVWGGRIYHDPRKEA